MTGQAAGDRPAAPDRASLSARILILVGGLFAALALTGVAAILPVIDAALAHKPGDALLVKQLVGIVSLSMVLGAPLAGFLADRVGLRSTLIVAGTVYAVAGTAGLYVTSLPLLVASRFFVGLSAAAIQIVSLILVNRLMPPAERPRWFGRHMAVAMASTIVSYPIVAFVSAANWRFAFGLYAIGLVLIPLASADMDTGTDVRGAESVTDTPDTRVGWTVARYAVAGLLLGGIVYLPMIYTPFLLRERGMGGTSISAVALSVNAAAGAATALLYGRVRSRMSVQGAFMAVFGATGIGTLLMAISSTVPVFLSGLILFGLGAGWAIANLLAGLSARVAARHRSRAIGLVKAAHFMSAPVFIVMAEPVVRTRGYAVGMLMVAGAALAMLVLTTIWSGWSRRTTAAPAVAADRLATAAGK